ncbi:MAG: ECF transporter S component [Patescibacteria group bacterium]
MNYIKENILEGIDAKWLTQFLSLVSVATVLPFFIHSQLITGPIINAILVLALFLTGLRSALLISFLPSSIALGSGLLPLALAPTIPFIILGNIIFVLVIDLLSKKLKDNKNSYWLSTLSASGIKFIFLFLSVSILSNFFISNNLVSTVAKKMGYLQLATAILGSIIAYLFLQSSYIKKYD